MSFVLPMLCHLFCNLFCLSIYLSIYLFMWKLLTGIISEGMYCFIENENKLPGEQKSCRRKNRGTKDQLLIDKAILKDCKKRRAYLAMARMDYRKGYDFVPHSWILECLDMLGVAENVRSFLEKSMKKRKLLLNSKGWIYTRLTSIEISSKEITCHH